MNGVGGHVNIGAFEARIVFNDRKFGEHRHGKGKKRTKKYLMILHLRGLGGSISLVLAGEGLASRLGLDLVRRGYDE